MTSPEAFVPGPPRATASSTPAASPVAGFLRALRGREPRELEPFLHEAVVYRMVGFEPVVGLRAVTAYWRRMFETYEALGLGLMRHVRDGDVVIAGLKQLYLARRRPPLLLDSLAVYELDGERIRLWSDHPDGEIPDETTALWRRLRGARW